jgi:hypothetical protein
MIVQIDITMLYTRNAQRIEYFGKMKARKGESSSLKGKDSNKSR